jgi:hypothetical protein
MSASEKTYTFRASQDLAPRVRDALSALGSLLEEDATAFDEAMPAFSIAVLRRAREFEQPENQSALLRTTLEIFVEAVEKLAQDREYVRDYEQWAAEDEESRALRKGALKAAARRWDE